MRTRLLLATPLACSLVLAAAGAALSASIPRGDGDDTAKPFELGSKVDPQALSFRTLEGKTVTLADFLPKQDEAPREGEEPREAPIVVLDFWSIQCPVSRGYESRFKALHAAFASGEEPDVILLAIDSNHPEVDRGAAEPYSRIKTYVEDEEIAFTVLVDEGNAVADRFDAKTTPHVFVLDREQVLRYSGALDDDPNGKKERAERALYVEDAIAALRAGEELKVNKTVEHGCGIKRAPKPERGE